MSREDVIRQIIERESRRHPLDEDSAIREASDLHLAAVEHFGTWDTALRYAGVRSRRPATKVKYTAETTLHSIRFLCRNGYDLSSQRNMYRDRPLYEAARRHFGTWRKALRAAGLNLERARGFSKNGRPHSKRRIIAAILARRQEGLSLACKDVCLEDRGLATAAKSSFGSWRRALAAAELAPPEDVGVIRSRWKKEHIVDAIQRRNQEGRTIAHTATCVEDAALVAAARRHFGTWQDAVKAAGITDIE